MKTIECHFHHRMFELPAECVLDCSQQGANDEAVAYWQPKVALNYWTREEKINGLAEYGAWDRSELSELSDNEIEEKLLWIACHDAKEEMLQAEE